jgi:adenosylhomocysteine nucleosidase
MKLGIIIAMDEECRYVVEALGCSGPEDRHSLKFYQRDFEKVDIIIVRSGIGKVNAALCTQMLISEFHVDAIINVGVAGGVLKTIVPGDVVLGDSFVQHDFDLTAFGMAPGEIMGIGMYIYSDEGLLKTAESVCSNLPYGRAYTGKIASGDVFVSSVEKLKFIEENFGPVYAVEMEGAAVAQAAYINKVPFLVIRSISDNANNEASMDFNSFLGTACRQAAYIIKGIIDEIEASLS